ncbi:MAG: glycosyltransferase family 4 protein [Nitrospirota bacterium]|nr:glycosyltransferase family 4 protein [Nitrospirota bacterium]
MQKVLIIIDKWGWSYDTIAKGLVRYNHNPHLAFDIVSVADDLDFIESHHSQYDLVFALGWTLVFSKKKKDHYRGELPFLDRRKLITGIHSHRSWDGYASTPEESPTPPPELLEQLSKLRGINIISRRLFTIFKNAGLTNIALTENGVDTALFTPTNPINTDRRHPLIIGFSGSKEITKHDSLKGFSEFILPLDQIPNVQIKVLGGRGEHQVTREEMPDLYNQIDLYICASSSEGFSQSVLEASACGRGVLSTRVGGCEDLIKEGLNGFLFHRDLDDIQTLVRRLEADRQLVNALGEANRHITEQYYSWNIKVQDWLSFIESHLPVAQHIS